MTRIGTWQIAGVERLIQGTASFMGWLT